MSSSLYKASRALLSAPAKLALTGLVRASGQTTTVQSATMAQPAFKDHFSNHSLTYAQHRPTYPAALYAYLASLTLAHDLVWDCGTGNGQAAVGLAQHFSKVLATDASKEQVEQATAKENITYLVCPAERCEQLGSGSVDLVTVAQAVHWFDLGKFYAEARRVLKPHGIIAVWTYQIPFVTPEVDKVLMHYYKEIIWTYWPPERKLVDNGYADLPFPFEDVDLDRGLVKEFTSELSWSLPDVMGYLRSWSATQRYMQQHGADPLELIAADMQAAWGGAPEERKPVRYPIYMRVGRV